MQKLLLLAATISALFSCSSKEKAELILTNGNVYTLNESNPIAEAIAVKDGDILAAGNNDEIFAFKAGQTEVIDLNGKTVTPGFIESHGHFMGLGTSLMNVYLLDCSSYEDLIERVKKVAEVTPKGDWIQGRGWHQSKWNSISGDVVEGFPTHKLLSESFPDHPVALRHASGHALMANAKAMELANVNAASDFGTGGEIIKDIAGQPTGIFNERAATLITNVIPDISKAQYQKAFELATTECLRHGITSFHDAGIYQDNHEFYLENLEQGNFKIRMYAMISSRDTAMLTSFFENGPMIGAGKNFYTVRSIKMYTDGALGSRGAWLTEAYHDMPGHFGHSTQPMEYVLEVSKNALKNGLQVCSHAIGDRANHEVLNQYQTAFDEHPEQSKDHRFRVEHAQHLLEDDIPRFAQLGVIAAMQGIHMSSDRPWAIDRLGKDRIEEGAYVWQKLLQSGAKIINGTDVPVEPINPMACYYASVARKTLLGTPEQGYEPDQKMSRMEALKTYTIDAAYGAFEEDQKGSIEVGKVADLTVWSKDLVKVPENEILSVEAVMTIVDGKIQYQK